jgi:TRAP-type C4-dicarboxylate transport system permease small subunit
MLEQQRTNRLLQAIVCVALGFLFGVVAMQVMVYLAPR